MMILMYLFVIVAADEDDDDDIWCFYAPNFEKVEGAYCFGLVHACIQNLR